MWPSEGGMGAAYCETVFIVAADFCWAQEAYARSGTESM